MINLEAFRWNALIFFALMALYFTLHRYSLLTGL
jgi:hypothetical protein